MLVLLRQPFVHVATHTWPSLLHLHTPLAPQVDQ